MKIGGDQMEIGETVMHNGEEYTCVGTQNGKPMCMPTKTVEQMGLPFVPLYLKGTWAELDQEVEDYEID